MKKVISLLLAVLLITSLLCACGGGSNTDPATEGGNTEKVKMTDEKIKDEIVGAWTTEIDGQTQGYIFKEDGTGLATILPMTYTVENGQITMTIEAFGDVETLTMDYDVDGDTLTFEKDGEKISLERTEMPEELQ